MLLVNDIEGSIIGLWRVLEYSHVVEKKNTKGHLRRRHYWKVICTNCCNERIIEEYNLSPPAGGKCQHCMGRPKGHSGFLNLLDSYKRNSKAYNREFLLSEKEFRVLTSQRCHYCGLKPSQLRRARKNVKSRWGDYRCNGLDRIDNEVGYIKHNVVPCCLICNRAKNNLSYNSFLDYIKRLKEWRENV